MNSSFSHRLVTPSRQNVRSLFASLRRVLACSLALALLCGIVGSSLSSVSAGAATSKTKALFVAVSNSYSAGVTEFNLVIASFSACTSATCVGAAIEGLGDTRFYNATVALEKKAPYASGISKDVLEYVGNLVTIQKDVNTVAKAKTVAQQRSIVSGTLELDFDDLAFRGMHILIYLGEQKKF